MVEVYVVPRVIDLLHHNIENISISSDWHTNFGLGVIFYADSRKNSEKNFGPIFGPKKGKKIFQYMKYNA